MDGRDYTVTYQYSNGLHDAMVIEGAKSPMQAQLAVTIYTTGLGGIKNVAVNETTSNDEKYTRYPALNGEPQWEQ